MTLGPGVRLGPYEILAPLGAGGMGEVYTATDTRLGRTVAIKVLPAGVASDPERCRRFEQEARAIAALSHPHICVLYDIGDAIPTGPQPHAYASPEAQPQLRQGELAPGPSSSVSFLVMEFLEGETLAVRLRRGPLPLSEALAAGAQMADALGAAHRRGIVHRDLKPGNVMLTPTGVKLLDFGLAKLKPAATEVLASRSALTTVTPEETSGALVGTVPYMAPEQLEGKPVDARTDVFALGCVLYEMLTGRRAFEGASAASVITAILTSEPAPVSALQPVTPPLLDRLVRTCLAKNPSQRWESAHDVAEQLRAISDVSATPVVAPGPPAAASSRGWWSRRRALLAGAATLAVVALAVAALYIRPRAPRTAAPAVKPSVVALPCKVPDAPEFAYFADGVPSSLTDELTKLSGLEVKSPPATLEVDKVGGDREKLARLYPVSFFIETSFAASPDGDVLSVRLVEPASKNVVWSQPYAGARSRYRELVRDAADGIRTHLKLDAPRGAATELSGEAELAFRRGVFLYARYRNRGEASDFDAALEAYSRALAVEPRLAPAAGNIANLYVARIQKDGYSAESRASAEKWAGDALGIDPRCAEAWWARSAAELFSPQADPAKGIDYAVRAVAFAPQQANAHLTLGMWGLGSSGLFTAAMQKAAELDPFLLGSAANAAVGLANLGRPDEGRRLLERALVVGDPGNGWGRAALGYVLLKLGRLEEAEAALRDSQADCAKLHTFAALWRYVRFALAVTQKDTSTAETLARQILAQVFEPKADANLISDAPMFAGPPLVRMGRADDAMRLLVRSVEAGAAPAYDWLLTDPDIRRLRGDARFDRVLAESRAFAALTTEILGKARMRGELSTYLHAPLDELVKLLKENGGRD